MKTFVQIREETKMKANDIKNIAAAYAEVQEKVDANTKYTVHIQGGADGMSSSEKAKHKADVAKHGGKVTHKGMDTHYHGTKSQLDKPLKSHMPDWKSDGLHKDVTKWHNGDDIRVKKHS